MSNVKPIRPKFHLDVIADVGPGGHFLAQKHTRRHLREIWIPRLTQPRPLQDEAPLPDIRHTARGEFDRVLAEHEPVPLEEAVQTELQAILDAAARDLST